jgi:hypothetical protein
MSASRRLLCLGLLLFGAGACKSDKDQDDTGKDSLPDSQADSGNTEACLEQAFRDQLAPLLSGTCSLCHSPNGVASSSNLVFGARGSDWPTALETQNYEALSAWLDQSPMPQMLYKKPTAVLSHGGNQVISPDSEAAAVLKYFVAQFLGQEGCEPVTSPVLDTASFLLADWESSLWQAARLIIERRPTESEWLAVMEDGESGFESALESMMEERSFAVRVSQIVEDVLHTNTWRSRYNATWIMRAWGLLEDTEGNTRGNYKWMLDYAAQSSDEFYAMLDGAAYGFSRSPRKLVEYLITEDRDFGEILTADYTMMNPYSVRTYGAESQITGSLEPATSSAADREFFEPVVLADVPTAGLLTDINFLTTYPTDPVNLNRNRSREIQDHFLATDILSLTERTSIAFGSTEVNPTWEDTSCLTCHTVMDPISGAFQNWPRIQYQGFYDPDHVDAQERWASELDADRLQSPGASVTLPIPEQEMDRSLQWLAVRIVQDPRFGISITEMMLEGLTGREPLRSPGLGEDDYGDKLRAWQLERSLVEEIAKSFMESGRDIRVLFKALLRSPLIRNVGRLGQNEIAGAHFGLNKMPHPEDLERKLRIATGYSWYAYYQRTGEDESNYHWNNHIDRPNRSNLMWYREVCGNGGNGCYARWYGLLGGLDVIPEGGNDARLTDPNVIVSAIFSRMGTEMAMRIVPRDFAIVSEQDGLFVRRLFPYVDLDTVPEDDEGHLLPENEERILLNIQHLHELILGEILELDDEEILETYALFLSIWQNRPESPVGLNFSGRVELAENEYLAAWEAANGLPLLSRREILKDEYHTERSWRIVLNYLLTDVRFLYDQLDSAVGQ